MKFWFTQDRDYQKDAKCRKAYYVYYSKSLEIINLVKDIFVKEISARVLIVSVLEVLVVMFQSLSMKLG